ncbi:phosphopantetheine-binding protein [Streptomyces sp. NPDC050256]|uniref:phosphopantetheine-binding protein n=1 Tax=unclassified Streptomyces TaxID=2593676 RepID=UPI0037897D25
MAQIWRQTLDVEKVEANADFFALGGHSLMAIRVSMLAADEFGVDVPAAALIADSCFNAMAERIHIALQQRDAATHATADPMELEA